jgi:phage/plasmid-associated DNA primase
MVEKQGSSKMRLIGHSRQTRKGLPLDEFAPEYSEEEAREALSALGHTQHEYLRGAASVEGGRGKIYLDGDWDYEQEPSNEVKRSVEAEVRASVQAICDGIYAGMRKVAPKVEKPTYVLASRHGVKAKKGVYRLSYRAYIQGVYMTRYWQIKRLVTSLEADGLIDAAHLHRYVEVATADGVKIEANDKWDLEVYKKGEQLVGAINGCKGDGDKRILTMEDPSHDVLMYTVQWVPSGWEELDVPEEARIEAASTSMQALQLTDSATATNEDEAFIRDMLTECLAEERSACYNKWLNVGLLLFNESHTSGCSYFDAWVAFSLRDKSEWGASPGEAQRRECRSVCEDKWRTFDFREDAKHRLSVGTLVTWAKKDNMAAYEQAVHAHKQRKQQHEQHGVEEEVEDQRVNVPQIVNALKCRLRIDDDVSEGHVRAKRQKQHRRVKLEVHGGKQLTYTVDGSLIVRDEQDAFMCLLQEKVRLPGHMGFLHKYMPDDATYNYTRPSEGKALLKPTDEKHLTEVEWINPGEQSEAVWVKHPERGKLGVTAKAVGQLHAVVSAALEAVASSVYGIYIGEVNITVNQGNDEDSSIRADSELAKAWYRYQKEVSKVDNDAVQMYKVVQVPDGYYYYFQRSTNTWYKTQCMDNVVNHVLEGMETIQGGRFMKECLSDAERQYIRSMRGGTLVFRRSLNTMLDPKFEKKLDGNMAILPFDNGAYELTTGTFRPLRWDDYVTTTIGYDYNPNPSKAHMELVERFFEQVLPYPDERELFLRMAGNALSGIPVNKKCVVLQDYRGGDNGKSQIVKGLLAAFGNFSMPPQQGYLNASTNVNPNNHDAATLSYKGKRLALFDETDPNVRFDLAKLKSLTGGAPWLAARGCRNANMTEFRWSAFILIACNKRCLPHIDAADIALINRLLTIPMRSYFNDAAAAKGVPFSFPMDLHLQDKLREAKMAIMLTLLGALARHNAAGGVIGDLPAGCLELRQAIICDSDPVYDYISEQIDKLVEFQLERTEEQRGRKVLGYVSRKDLAEEIKITDIERRLKRVHSSKLKQLIDAVMASRGRPLVEDTNIGDLRVFNVYKDCILKV